jgi:hypothetical protein
MKRKDAAHQQFRFSAVPPLFQGIKNTTLHELQTHDRSRATDRNLEVD